MDRAARRRGLQDREAPPGLHRAHRDEVHAGRRALTVADDATALPVWLDGRLIEAEAARAEAVRRTLDRTGCHTTTRVVGGRPAFASLHVSRLARDAGALGLPTPDAGQVAQALFELAHAAFGDRDGIVRVKACATDDRRSCLVGTARPLGDDTRPWTAVVAPFPHPGGGRYPGAKLTERPAWTRARALYRSQNVDETLLFDADGHLVEGARSNVVVLRRDGALAHPEPALGAVAGIGLSVLSESADDLAPGRIRRSDLDDAREVVAVNAVRGARAIVRIDGRDVADGRPGSTARALSARFEAALQDDLRASR